MKVTYEWEETDIKNRHVKKANLLYRIVQSNTGDGRGVVYSLMNTSTGWINSSGWLTPHEMAVYLNENVFVPESAP